MKVSGHLTPLFALHSREHSPRYSLYTETTAAIETWFLGRPARSLVAISTELCRLSQLVSYRNTDTLLQS
jgi:hypothetical protein